MLYSDDQIAGWIPPGRGWWPRPRRADAADSNADWITERCHQCRCFVARLRARCHIRAGSEIVAANCPSPNWDEAKWPYEATFDGGARLIRGTRVAGAGATLWRHDVHGGPPSCIARAQVAIPWDAGAQVAEAFGCCAALSLLEHVDTDPRSARIVGDNLGVIRYCAGTARLRRATMQAQLERSVGNVLARGWSLTWQAVRRRLNTAADVLATSGVRWAAQLADAGQYAVQTHVQWHDDDPDQKQQ